MLNKRIVSKVKYLLRKSRAGHWGGDEPKRPVATVATDAVTTVLV